ncbi:ABC transporter substrate-binding protein [Sneathiella sp.]|jgi:NitT/TauT family transport system substrate-binding protein|uniref:ABC transporter substrate-binding protein n=1 Tax=Sneathiella sp. TaxID=1964365 RepID=UPI0039E52184
MAIKQHLNTDRRRFVKGIGATVGMAAAGTYLGFAKSAQADTFNVNMQLGWIASNGQLGEVAADHLGYYEKEGLSLTITPGGPNVDGVASVASGRAQVGQLSSSPSLMLARSAGIPIKCVAAGYQQHPFTYFSLKKNPIKTPQDMVGKTIGTQGTARILLRAMLAKHDIAYDDVNVVVMGGDMGPLMNGQVDAVSGWQSNINALNILGDQRVDMRLWDSGIQLYANPFYVTDETLQQHSDKVEAFVRATAKGWGWVHANPQKAVELLVKRYPNLNLESERKAVDVILKYVFNEETKTGGWGTMKAINWEQQIETYAKLDQFKGDVPTLGDVMTLDILDATKADRPKVG